MMIHKKAILFIIITFASYATCAAETSLPKLPDEKYITETTKTSSESFFQKIKNFFGGKKNKPIVIHSENKPDEPFIDLSNTKLPTIAVEKTENLSTIGSTTQKPQPSANNELPLKKNSTEQIATKKSQNIQEPSKHVIDTTTPKIPEALKNKIIEQKTPTVLEKHDDGGKNSQSNKETVKPLVIEEKKPVKLEPSPEQIKFSNDETTVLLMANDDVVLGEVTDKAKISLMDAQSFIDLIYKHIELYNKIIPHNKILDFVHQYDKIFPDKSTNDKQIIEQVYDEATISVNKENISDLKTLIDSYPILQMTNTDGQSLLHIAAIKGDYTSAKYLVMKGININKLDLDGYTAINLAKELNNNSIYKLLTRASGNKF